MGTLEEMMALSNGLSGGNIGSDASATLAQLLQNSNQQRQSFWNSPGVALAAGLLKGVDSNGNPMTVGQGIGQGLENIIAMKQKQAVLDKDNLNSAIYLRSTLGQDKLKWVYNPKTGQKVQVSQEDLQRYLDAGYSEGVPVAGANKSDATVEMSLIMPDGSVRERKFTPEEVAAAQNSGWFVGTVKNLPNEKSGGDKKEPSASEVNSALSAARALVGYDPKAPNQGLADQAQWVVDRAMFYQGEYGGSVVQYITRAKKEMDAALDRERKAASQQATAGKPSVDDVKRKYNLK